MTYYLFGVVENLGQVDTGIAGFANAYGERSAVKGVSFGGLSMLVCELDDWRVNEADKTDLLKKLIEHQKTLECIMQRQFILPVKFGTVVEAEQDVVGILNHHHASLDKNLRKMKDFVEVDVVASWEPIEMVKKIAATDEDIKKMRAVAEAATADKRAKAVMAVGAKLEEKLEEKRSKVEKTIMGELSSCSEEFVSHERLEAQMIVNSSFLIKKGGEKKFFDALGKLDKRLDYEIKFKCLHPLPPHSFATIVVEKVDPVELEEALETFGVDEQVCIAELKEIYRSKVKKLHPDKAGKQSSGAFDNLNRRFKLLEGIIAVSPLASVDKRRCYILDVRGGS